MASYMAGEGAMEQLMRCAVEGLAFAEIRVNAVRPGIVQTELGQTMSANGKIVEEILSEVALGRVGEPSNISGAVRYLAGPESSWATGQVIAVDGGSLLRKNPRLMEALIGYAARVCDFIVGLDDTRAPSTEESVAPFAKSPRGLNYPVSRE